MLISQLKKCFFSNAQSNKNKKIECNVWLTLEKQEPFQTENIPC